MFRRIAASIAAIPGLVAEFLFCGEEEEPPPRKISDPRTENISELLDALRNGRL